MYGVEFTMAAPWDAAFTRWVMSFGIDAEVLQPTGGSRRRVPACGQQVPTRSGACAHAKMNPAPHDHESHEGTQVSDRLNDSLADPVDLLLRSEAADAETYASSHPLLAEADRPKHVARIQTPGGT